MQDLNSGQEKYQIFKNKYVSVDWRFWSDHTVLRRPKYFQLTILSRFSDYFAKNVELNSASRVEIILWFWGLIIGIHTIYIYAIFRFIQTVGSHQEEMFVHTFPQVIAFFKKIIAQLWLVSETKDLNSNFMNKIWLIYRGVYTNFCNITIRGNRKQNAHVLYYNHKGRKLGNITI